MLALLLSLALALAFGALFESCLRSARDVHPLERVGRALTFGLGGLGMLSMLADVLGLGVNRLSVGGLTLAAAVGLLAWRRRAGADDSEPAPRQLQDGASHAGWRALSPQARAAAIGLFALAGIALFLQVRSGLIRPTYQFDALVRWMFKAKVLATDHTLFGAFSYEEAFGFTHQRYPPLVAHIANLPALLSGHFDDYIASAMFPFFALALVCLAGGALARHAGLLSGALVAAWIANLPLIAFVDNPPPGSGSWSAMADIPLALFVCAAGLSLIDLFRSPRGRAAWGVAACLALAALTKNEGLPLLAGASVALFLGQRSASPGARLKLCAQVVGVAVLVFVALWGHRIPGIPAYDENYYAQVGLEPLQAGVERLGLILMGTELQGFRMPGLLPELVSFRSWNLTWPLIAVLLLLGGKRSLSRVPRALLLLLAVQLAAYVGAYMVTAWESPNARALVGPGGDPLAFLLNLTLGRLLLHLAPLAICVSLLVSPLRASRSG
ncbi:MAG: hypothetical protein DHS20C15_00550 [Planctomycetota bacterium]|nr:MAG: hypothetical protein DHS20C15_00550 [Planctomycetota bacterium]